MKEFQDLKFKKSQFFLLILMGGSFLSSLFPSSHSYIKNPFGQMSSVDTSEPLREMPGKLVPCTS